MTELWPIGRVAAHLKVSASRARAILASRGIKRVSGYPADQVKAITLRQGARTDLARYNDQAGDTAEPEDAPDGSPVACTRAHAKDPQVHALLDEAERSQERREPLPDPRDLRGGSDGALRESQP